MRLYLQRVPFQYQLQLKCLVKQTVLPDIGYDYLSQVVVNAISYVEATNSAGGTTVTIAG